MLDPEEIADGVANDPVAMAEIQERAEKATSTVMDLLWSGVTMEDALDIVRGAITEDPLPPAS